jgi:hypothetical protein
MSDHISPLTQLKPKQRTQSLPSTIKTTTTKKKKTKKAETNHLQSYKPEANDPGHQQG